MAHSNPTTILIGLMRSLRMTLGRGTDGFIGVRSRVMQFYPFFNSLATKAPNRWRRLKLKGVIPAARRRPSLSALDPHRRIRFHRVPYNSPLSLSR